MKLLHHLVLLILFYSLTGCSTFNQKPTDHNSNQWDTALSAINSDENQLFKEEFSKWQGTPYKYGGNGLNGVDCSAFVKSVIYSSHQLQLPRTTEKQVLVGKKIELSEAKSGDLLFFKTTKKDKHVGIYLGYQQFMHASTSKGVIISRLNNPYWASVFWQARRIL